MIIPEYQTESQAAWERSCHYRSATRSCTICQQQLICMQFLQNRSIPAMHKMTLIMHKMEKGRYARRPRAKQR